MEPESHDAAQSRRYEAAESMLQHAKVPRIQPSGLNGLLLPKSYPLESDPPQPLNHVPAIPIIPYPDLSMPIQRPHPGQNNVYNPLLDNRLSSPQGIRPQIDQRLAGHPAAHIAPPDKELHQLSHRGLQVHDGPFQQTHHADQAEIKSPVSSRGVVSKESESSKPSTRPVGKKAGKKSSAVKQEEEKPPPWSELKTKAGKERKRLPLACIACRRKKIRCSGEKPACKHCFRSRTPCVYKVTTRKAVPRTDYMAMLEKRLKRMEERVIKIIPEDEASNIAATGRAQVRPPTAGQGNKAQGGKKRAADEAFGPDPEEWADSRTSKPSAQGKGSSHSKQSAEGADKLPSKEIQEHLAEVYFDCLYGQSYLLLHKPSFIRRLRAGTAPPVLILAVCAIAARFSTHPHINSEPVFLRGEEWAAPAREIALKRYDQPSITILTVLLILGLHEFGTCQGGRSWMFGGMAVRMAYALQLHRELDHDPLRQKEDADRKLSATDREIRRRTMWACFMMDRFNSSGTERPTCASEEHIEIQLPNKEFNFHNEVLGPTEKLDAANSYSALLDTGQKVNLSDNMGVASYVVRIIVLWGRIIRYVNLGGIRKDSCDLWHPQSGFGELKRQAEEFKASLPSDIQYNADNLASMATEKLANQFLFLHISYYQVVLFLHRYAVPTTPGATMAFDIPRDVRSASAQVAVEAADHISELIRHASEHNVHAPFAGYCAFTSSTVHIWSMFSNQPRLQASAKRNLGINLEYIRKMKKFWGMFHFMHDHLMDIWQKHEGHASRKGTYGGDAVKLDGSLFQYSDWFQKYPHGVSETDYEDAATKVKEERINEAAKQKTDLPSEEAAPKKGSPPVRPPQLYRKPNRRRSKSTTVRTRPHPPQVLPPNFALDMPNQAMVPMAPQTAVAASPFNLHPPLLLYPTMPPQTYDMLGENADMGLLQHHDRNIVYDAYAGTSGPSIPSADASLQAIAIGDQKTGMWEQAMGDVDAQAQAMDSMGTYMGHFQQSSAWFMPFNMPAPNAVVDDGGNGYGGFAMQDNRGHVMGGVGGDGNGGQ